jgi:hypothetical protein
VPGALLGIVAFLLLSAYGCAASASTSHAPQTPQQRLATLARRSLSGRPSRVVTAYDAQAVTASVQVTLDMGVPRTPQDITAAQEQVKTLCFEAQHALWTSGIGLHAVTVQVLGPIYDDFFDKLTDWYGGAKLTAAAAAALSWSSLGADSAWTAYDQVWLRPSYVPNQHYGAPPAGTPAAAA